MRKGILIEKMIHRHDELKSRDNSSISPCLRVWPMTFEYENHDKLIEEPGSSTTLTRQGVP